MKKTALISILLLITGVMGFAQSLEMYESVGGQDVKRQNGETLVKELDASKPYVFYMKVKNVSAATKSVFCKKVYINILPNSDNTFCWDVCYIPSVMVSKHPIDIPAGALISKFDATYESYGYSGDSKIRYVWFDGSKPSDSVAIEVIFRARPLGLEESMITLNALVASPNPANAVVKLNWKPFSAPAKLTVHDLIGNKIVEKPIERSAGEEILYTDGFPDGLYFCILESEGQVSVVKKIMIRH